MNRFFLAGACAAILLLNSSCAKKGESAAQAESAIAGSATLRDVISQTGEVRAVVNVELKCEASGRIDIVHVREGELISKGQKILEIDPERLLRRKKKLQLDIEEATIRLDQARRNYDNSTRLEHTGTVSKTRLDDLHGEFRLRQIALEQRNLELEDVTDELRKTTVVSPMDGVITTLSVEEGEIAVSATSGFQAGTQIATIADISRLEVVSQIGEVDYVHLSKGQNVMIRPEALEGVSTHGTIDFVSLTAKKKNNDELGTFEVRIAVDSVVAGLVPGVNVSVEFVVLEKEVAVAVPFKFVTKGPRGQMVTVKNGKGTTGEARKVELGKTDYRNYEILSGLAAGETVLFLPQSDKPDGRPGGGRRGG